MYISSQNNPLFKIKVLKLAMHLTVKKIPKASSIQPPGHCSARCVSIYLFISSLFESTRLGLISQFQKSATVQKMTSFVSSDVSVLVCLDLYRLITY